MNFRSYSDLVTTLAVWQQRLPRDFTLICGIPRSGLMVASLLALQWNLPVTDVASLAAGRVLPGGRRQTARGVDPDRFLDTPQRILVVEDSVCAGAGVRRARADLAAVAKRHEIRYAAVYAALEGRNTVDYVAEVIGMPRVFEWNLFHHPVLRQSCVDIDGVLCRDPSGEENDDGPRYREFLRSVEPRFVPSEEIGWLVTGRLEKYRSETEEWLRRHGIRYRELRMLDVPDMQTRRETGAAVAFKAEQYRRTGAELFIESDPRQAAEIAARARRHVIATDSMQLHGP
ncbi:MAG TPA: orotate phosphoribosyltransferase, partial [Methylomirabilota bacterium]|nr:orotate phosphoribosyltransferase [Methylomirabilota bacterium]